MNVSSDEKISALTDDEVPVGDMPALLRELANDRDLLARLGRYGLIRDALHRNLPPTVDAALVDKVAMSISLEPAHVKQSPAAHRMELRRWTRPIAGFAITASVAVLAVVIWPAQQRGSDATDSVPIAQATSIDSERPFAGLQTVSSDTIQWDRLDPDVQSRLNGYAITHGDQSVGRQVGIVPRHVRSTGRDADQ